MRTVLLAAAGIASLAYVALRPKAPPVITRELSLASLDRHVANWLPKLPFVRYIRIGIPPADLLELSGNGTAVRARLLQNVDRGQDRRYAFRRSCAELGLTIIETEEEGQMGSCELPAQGTVVAHALESLLRNVFDVDETSRLVATIPHGD